MRKLFGIFFSLTLLGLFLTNVSTVFAQENQGLNITISPSSFDITAKPGEKIQQRFRVRNNMSVPLTLHLHADILSVDEKGQIVPVTAKTNDSYLTWLELTPVTTSAKPKEWTDFSVTLSVPSDAAFGYYYALHITQDPMTVTDSTTKVLGDVILPILLNVEKVGENREGKISSFLPTNFVNEYLPVDFTVDIKNTGNTHLRPHGNIFIRDGNKDIATIDVNQAGGAILPDTSRKFQSSWSDGFFVITTETKDGRTEKHLQINWDKIPQFRIGKYTANLSIIYDGGTRDILLEKTTTFWIFPYRLIGGTLIGIALCIFLVRVILKFYIRHEIQKHQKKV